MGIFSGIKNFLRGGEETASTIARTVNDSRAARANQSKTLLNARQNIKTQEVLNTLNTNVEKGIFTGDYFKNKQNILDTAKSNVSERQAGIDEALKRRNMGLAGRKENMMGYTKKYQKTESSGSFTKDFSAGLTKAFGKDNWLNPIVKNAMGGAAVGAFSGAVSTGASFLDPDHIQSNGLVKSAVKGGLAGALLGAAHVGIQGGHAMTTAIKGTGETFGHKAAANLPGFTKNWSKSAAIGGALAMSVVGSTNIRTKASNPLK